MAPESVTLAIYLLLGIALPAFLSFGLVIATRKSGGGATGTALACAFLTAWLAERGGFEVPGSERWHAVAAVLIAVGFLSPWLAVLQGRMPRALASWLACLVLGAALGRWVAFPGWTPFHAWALGGTTAIVGIAAEWCADRRHGASIPAALGVAVGAEACLLALSGFFSLALPAAALSVALLGTGVAIRDTAAARDDASPRTIAGGGALTAIVALTLLAFAGWSYNYSPIEPWMWLTPVAAPLMLLIPEVPALSRRYQRAALAPLLLRALPAIVLCGWVVFAAWRTMTAADANDPLADMYG